MEGIDRNSLDNVDDHDDSDDSYHTASEDEGGPTVTDSNESTARVKKHSNKCRIPVSQSFRNRSNSFRKNSLDSTCSSDTKDIRPPNSSSIPKSKIPVQSRSQLNNKFQPVKGVVGHYHSRCFSNSPTIPQNSRVIPNRSKVNRTQSFTEIPLRRGNSNASNAYENSF